MGFGNVGFIKLILSRCVLKHSLLRFDLFLIIFTLNKLHLNLTLFFPDSPWQNTAASIRLSSLFFAFAFVGTMDIRITPPATRKERAARHHALMALRQQGMQVGGFAQTFWMFSVGLNYNEAALKSFFNVCLDDPLPQWEMEGLGIMDFWGFVKYLQVRVQCMVPDQSEPLCRDFSTASALPTPTERWRVRRRKAESTPEPTPDRELTESTPEPTPDRELTESTPEPTPDRELTESTPEPAPVWEPTEFAPEPTPVREPTESTPELSAGQEAVPEPAKLLALSAPPMLKLPVLLAPFKSPAWPEPPCSVPPAPPWPSSRVLVWRSPPWSVHLAPSWEAETNLSLLFVTVVPKWLRGFSIPPVLPSNSKSRLGSCSVEYT